MTNHFQSCLIATGCWLLVLCPFVVSAEQPLVKRQLARSLVGEGLRSALQRVRAPRAIPVSIEQAPRALKVDVATRIPQGSSIGGQGRVEPVVPPALEWGEGRLGAAAPQSAVTDLLGKCRYLASRGYPYIFGAESPAEGGFDCSGVVHYVLGSMGLKNVPRVAYDQHRWLETEGTLQAVHSWTSADKLFRRLRPGDLLFWKGTYNTGRQPNISHIMVYAGRDRQTGEHLMFGARSGSLRGRNGNSVDMFPFVYPKKGSRGKLVGFGRVPGL
jgi:cell wall-associated NlpC family hydrolase